MSSDDSSSSDSSENRRVSLTGKAPASKAGVASQPWGFESLTLRSAASTRCAARRPRRVGRVVYCTAVLMRKASRPQRFESSTLRSTATTPVR